MCFIYSSQRGSFLDLFLGPMPAVTQATFVCSVTRFSCLYCLSNRNNLWLWSWFLCLSSLCLIGRGEYAVSRQKQIKSALISLMTNVQEDCMQMSVLTVNQNCHGENQNQGGMWGFLWEYHDVLSWFKVAAMPFQRKVKTEGIWGQ